MQKDKTKKEIPDSTSGPGRPRQFGDRVQVVVYLERSELLELKRAAGSIPLSTYIRDLVQKKIKDGRKKK